MYILTESTKSTMRFIYKFVLMMCCLKVQVNLCVFFLKGGQGQSDLGEAVMNTHVDISSHQRKAIVQ